MYFMGSRPMKYKEKEFFVKLFERYRLVVYRDLFLKIFVFIFRFYVGRVNRFEFNSGDNFPLIILWTMRIIIMDIS